MKYIIEYLTQSSAELIDLAAALEMNLPETVQRGTRAAIESPLRQRDRNMRELEKWLNEDREAKARMAEKRTLLQTIANSFSEAFAMTIQEDSYRGPHLKGVDFSMELDSVKVGYKMVPNGRLNVYSAGDTRRFPRKADGTFNVGKIAEFIRTQRESVAAAHIARDAKADALKRFNELVRPYTRYNAYETHADFQTPDAAYRIVQVGPNRDQYIIQRIVTTSETVSAERAAEILAGVLTKVERPANGGF